MKNLRILAFVWVTLLNVLPLQAKEAPPNVILFMVDGVRWQEFFHGSDPTLDAQVNEPVIFKNLLNNLGNSFISGDLSSGSQSTISNPVMISLPGYQSIMTGKPTGCRSNSCGRTLNETLQERIRKELNLKPIEVATIASWNEIPNAVEKQKGSTYVNAGVQPILEGELTPLTLELNKKQKEDQPSWDGRKDEYTFAQALNFLKSNKPRFLFISLGDADEEAHAGKYSKYVASLKGYDEKFKALVDTLNSMGDYGQSTSIIFTTDHGRGNGKDWTDHGTGAPESRYIWIYGINPRLKQKPIPTFNRYSHLDIRPTVEKLLGLKPMECQECGRVIQELIPNSQTTK